MTPENQAQFRVQNCSTPACWEAYSLAPTTQEFRPVVVNQVWTGMAAVMAIALMVWFTTTQQ